MSWHESAIIYQVHVRAFADSDADGVGDFSGLIKRLDYIRALGVTAIWLQPFFPSPLRDDGYDVSDYLNVNPLYGSLADFDRFVQAAHEREIRVIVELVVNHTSDQHQWFKKARQSPKDSPERQIYVWSDDNDKFSETRIIFIDTESSNWAWDEEAKAYYWHRFFSHQPDLNHNNPEVVERVIDVMRFWARRGVDGFRLDAIPYLCVREGTQNESIPETHAVVRQIRAALSEEFPECVLLAEANQPLVDTAAYFGSGDECHLAFHFPLMPRLYMSLAQSSRRAIVDIWEKTPDPPQGCRWVTFLRNHDELTLEMVNDEERRLMYETYARDPLHRRNVGICRRLAPLMNGDARRIRLMNLILFFLPGVPVVYYGDEIGMGDNTTLPDRFGVRTPMQWSSAVGAGFSTASPSSFYLPLVEQAPYSYRQVNVANQEGCADSHLEWMRRLILFRRESLTLQQGNFEWVDDSREALLVAERSYRGERLRMFANLGDSSVNISPHAAGTLVFASADCVDNVLPPFGAAIFSSS